MDKNSIKKIQYLSETANPLHLQLILYSSIMETVVTKLQKFQNWRIKMTKSNTNANHKSNQSNSNKGTSGTNPANGHMNGNRGKQLNPTNKK